MVQNMHQEWKTFSAHVDAHTLAYLSMSSSLLEAKGKVPLLPDEQIAAWRATLTGLLEEVVASQQPMDVKSEVSRALRAILSTLDEYKITGSTAISAAVEVAFGKIVTNKSYRSIFTDPDLGKRIFDFLTALANAVTVTVGVLQLPQAMHAAQLLLP
jgi:hypothetical protein